MKFKIYSLQFITPWLAEFVRYVKNNLMTYISVGYSLMAITSLKYSYEHPLTVLQLRSSFSQLRASFFQLRASSIRSYGHLLLSYAHLEIFWKTSYQHHSISVTRIFANFSMFNYLIVGAVLRMTNTFSYRF